MNPAPTSASKAGTIAAVMTQAMNTIQPPDQQERVLAWLQQHADTAGLDSARELARLLEALGADPAVIAAGMLSEALGTLADEGPLQQAFGDEVCSLYRETRRFIDDPAGWLRTAEQHSEPAEDRQWLLLALLEDMRVVFVLLAHQVLLMRGLKERPPEQQRQIAAQTRGVFAPLANRLGIARLKWELEDLAFRYLEPDHYHAIARALEERRSDRERYIEQVVAQLRQALREAGIEAEVYGRPKHIYSIWRKMQRKQLDFDQLYDVRALRVMVDTLEQCYGALAVVHGLWRFIPGEYDDYIAAPKPNGYQSLHTAVIGPGDKTLEIQIRTRAMHRHAELGVAAHWRYKEGGRHDATLEHRIENLRALIRGAGGNDSPVRGASADIYVLSPQGRVVELPAGATPLDFAYRIHTELGHRCRGARVDGQMVPLSTPLRSGQQVEILTAKQARPSRDWLNPELGYLKSRRARAKVRHWFKQQYRDEHIAAGRAALQRELGKARAAELDLAALATQFNYRTADDLLAALGRGELGLRSLHNAIVRGQGAPANETPSGQRAPASQAGAARFSGADGLLTKLARCCKPMPGDAIVGYVTQGRGVSIHRRDCRNLAHLSKRHPQRLLDVDWTAGPRGHYPVDVEVEAMDRPGLLRDVTSVLAAEEVNVLAANTHSNRQRHTARMRLSLELADGAQLRRVLGRLLQVHSVFEARRVD